MNCIVERYTTSALPSRGQKSDLPKIGAPTALDGIAHDDEQLQKPSGPDSPYKALFIPTFVLVLCLRLRLRLLVTWR